MCLIAFALHAHPDYPLVLVAHRDEFLARRTQAAHRWEDAPTLIAGRDLEQGGTWMGITEAGRFAALTNYRNPALDPKTPLRSRGALVSDFLRSDSTPEAYLQAIAGSDADFAGYNLLVGDFSAKGEAALWYHSNRAEGTVPVSAGIHGLSNALLDTPWWKTQQAKQRLQAKIVEGGAATAREYIALLRDDARAPEELLPATGIPTEMEAALSSMFISLPHYGTRCATFIAFRADGSHMFVEQQTADGAVYEA